MRHKQTLLITMGCLIMLTATTSTVYSSESANNTLPAYYPSHFPKLGVLTEVRGQYDWVISGRKFQVSNNVIVHSLVTNFSSLYSIKQGMEIAYRKNNAGQIAEVWQLPDGSVELE